MEPRLNTQNKGKCEMERLEPDHLNTALELLLKDHEETRKLVREVLIGLDQSRDKLIATLLDIHRAQMSAASNPKPRKGTE